jgi:hypothetical protein
MFILRSPDGQLVEVESAVLRTRLKAQGYREVEPDVNPDREAGHDEDFELDDTSCLLADGEADEG